MKEIYTQETDTDSDLSIPDLERNLEQEFDCDSILVDEIKDTVTIIMATGDQQLQQPQQNQQIHLATQEPQDANTAVLLQILSTQHVIQASMSGLEVQMSTMKMEMERQFGSMRALEHEMNKVESRVSNLELDYQQAATVRQANPPQSSEAVDFLMEQVN